MRSAVENGSGERCLPLKIFVVFNPALLVESVPGILQLAINGCWLDCFLLCSQKAVTLGFLHCSAPLSGLTSNPVRTSLCLCLC